MAVAGLSVAALGIYSAREGTRVAGRAFDRRARWSPSPVPYNNTFQVFLCPFTSPCPLKGTRRVRVHGMSMKRTLLLGCAGWCDCAIARVSCVDLSGQGG